MDRQELALRLLKYRVQHNLTQDDFALKVKASKRTIVDIEKCKGETTLKTLVKISLKLDELEKGV